MTSRRSFLGGLAAVALTGLAQAQDSPPRLSVQGSPVQGFPLFVAVLGNDSLTDLKASFESRHYPLSWVAEANAWRAVVPVSIDCKARQTLRILQSGTALFERPLTIKARDYGTQYLTINADTLASYDDPRNKADDQAILNAMRTTDEQQRWRGNFQLPCDAPESTGFGQKRLYNGWKRGWHKGLDLAGWEGQAVKAPGAGKVIHRARGIVNGNTLVLSHGLGLFSVYFHLNDFEVNKGDEVEAGQAIASVGGTGGFAPHLHWEMRAFGSPVHPKAFLALPADWK